MVRRNMVQGQRSKQDLQHRCCPKHQQRFQHQKRQQSKQWHSSSSHKDSSLQDQQSDTANRNQWNNQWYNHSQRSNKYIQEKQFQDQRTHQQQQTIGSRKGNSIIKPPSEARGYRIDDDWTTKTSATMNFTWTGSTNF